MAKIRLEIKVELKEWTDAHQDMLDLLRHASSLDLRMSCEADKPDTVKIPIGMFTDGLLTLLKSVATSGVPFEAYTIDLDGSKSTGEAPAVVESGRPAIWDTLDTPLVNLGLSYWLQNAFQEEKLVWVGDVISEIEDFETELKVRGGRYLTAVGPVMRSELIERLAGMGLRLGMDMQGWKPPKS